MEHKTFDICFLPIDICVFSLIIVYLDESKVDESTWLSVVLWYCQLFQRINSWLIILMTVM